MGRFGIGRAMAVVGVGMFLLGCTAAKATDSFDMSKMPTGGTQWHVAVDGKADGKGTMESPWDIKTALAGPAAVKPGDIIWVHGGEYKGNQDSHLQGTAEKPIVVRAAKGERATIRGNIKIGYGWKAEYTWFWGLEVANRGFVPGNEDAFSISLSSRQDDNDPNSPLKSINPGIKVINCVLHDNGTMGVSTWGGADDNEVNGCVIYYNGFDGPDRGHGHGFYIQSVKGPKLIKDNVVFRNFNQGSQLYGSKKAWRNNVTHEGNVFFNNSEISLVGGKAQGDCSHMWIEGNRAAENPGIIANCTYAGPWAKAVNNLIGISENGVVKGNYFVSAAGAPVEAFSIHDKNQGLKVSDNTFYGKVTTPKDKTLADFGANNVVLTAPPAEVKVFVRPNDYEKGRANITIYNWPKKDKVEVKIAAAGLKSGQAYELRDAQNFYGSPVLKGAYDGKALEVPMTGLKVAAPEGLPASYKTPEHTAPDFGVFVLLPVDEGKAAK
jgi:hypothetical protein